MRFSDWSSDVCSSDLAARSGPHRAPDDDLADVLHAHRDAGTRGDHRLFYVGDRAQPRVGANEKGFAGTADIVGACRQVRPFERSEEHTSELQSLMRISYAVFCLKKKNMKPQHETKN